MLRATPVAGVALIFPRYSGLGGHVETQEERHGLVVALI